MVPVAAGVVAGLVLAWTASGVLAGILFGVPATDPGSFVVAAGVLLAAGVLASLVPAFRASRTDPAMALRAE
jgi:putative ABC transport system permease protein